MTKAEALAFIERVANDVCVTTRITGNYATDDNIQRCGCIVHQARAALKAEGGA